MIVLDILHFATIRVLSHPLSLKHFFFGSSMSLQMPMMCPMSHGNFTFARHISCFTSIITYVFLAWYILVCFSHSCIQLLTFYLHVYTMIMLMKCQASHKYIIIRINSFRVLNNKIFCNHRQTFTMTNNMAS